MNNFPIERVDSKKKEKFPDVSFNIYFASHYFVADSRKLRLLLDDCDVYVPEWAEYKPGMQEFLQRVSNGEITPDDEAYMNRVPPSFREKLRVLQNSHKIVILADVQKGEVEERGGFLGMYLATNAFLRGDFKSALNIARKAVEKIGQIQNKREGFIRSNLEKKLTELLRGNPKLKEKKLKVLMTMGAGHSTLFQNMQKDGLEVSREYNANLEIFSNADEVIRTAQLGKEIEDELLAKAILENELSELLPTWMLDDGQELARLMRRILDKFNLKDIEDLSKAFGASGGTVDALYAVLEEKGINFPRNREELEKIT
ncbi:MAG: hypothetical protein WCT29_03050 [Candidatus Paceibacterota bacterium]